MFENILYQTSCDIICDDVNNNQLPPALLFYGPAASGKFTAALELARVVSCKAKELNLGEKGSWTCPCPSCTRHRTLSNPDLLIAGSRDCMLEILASQSFLLQSYSEDANNIQSALSVFVRSVKKLSCRFNPILWEDDDKLSKINPLLSGIDEYLEMFSPSAVFKDFASLQKTSNALVALCEKLESGFMYESMPMAQIRRVFAWVHLSSLGNKKVLILENIDKMQDGVRNALLKMLEEPPENMLFILTTTRRGAILPTILSRVRTYSFVERSIEQQKNVIRRIFHSEIPENFTSLENFFSNYLPISQDKINNLAFGFVNGIEGVPKAIKNIIDTYDIDGMYNFTGDCKDLVSEAKNFEPKMLFRLFLTAISNILKQALVTDIDEEDCQIIQKWNVALKQSLEFVSIYNQSTVSALEQLYIRFEQSLCI